jgi:hypothetical protein
MPVPAAQSQAEQAQVQMRAAGCAQSRGRLEQHGPRSATAKRVCAADTMPYTPDATRTASAHISDGVP